MSSDLNLPPARHEATDASPKFVLVTSGVVGLGIGATLLASALLYGARFPGTASEQRGRPEFSFRHGADEQTGIARDWAEQDARVREHLTTYGWIDQQSGVVRIPIERAMLIVAGETEKEAR